MAAYPDVGLDEFREILPSGFLAILSSFAESVGFFDPFLKHFSLPMKEVSYSTIDKIATLFSSIVVGCSHIKDINHKLTPYPSAASLFGMKRFPDQSGINRFLNRICPQEISELSLIFERILDKVALFQDKEKMDLNVDATGITVYGDRYQFARKRVLSGTGIEDLGIQTITNKLTYIPAKFEKEGERLKIFFPAGHELARRFIQGKQDNHKGSIFPLEKKLYD